MKLVLGYLLISVGFLWSRDEPVNSFSSTSPSKASTLSIGHSVYAPVAVKEAPVDPHVVVVLASKDKEPLFVILEEGRLDATWSEDSRFVAISNQTDRANFSLTIIDVKDRKSVRVELASSLNAIYALFKKDGSESIATSPKQLTRVALRGSICRGEIHCKTASREGIIGFEVQLSDSSDAGENDKVVEAKITSEMIRKR